MTTDFVLDALEQAVYDRRPTEADGLVHHSDRGTQYVSIRYSDRLSEAGINPSVGSTGSAYDNALAETINGLYKTEVIHRRAPWKTKAALELATLEWISWFNHQRLGVSSFPVRFTQEEVPGFQLIITEHANLRDDWFQAALVEQPWTKPPALVPEDWPEQ